MNREEAQKFCRDNGIRYVLAQFVDIHGVGKGQGGAGRAPRHGTHRRGGIRGFRSLGSRDGTRGSGLHGGRRSVDAVGLIPWMPGYARLICNGVVNEKPYPYCSRVALQAQIARLEERGLTLFTGHRAGVHAARAACRRQPRAGGPHGRSGQALLRLQGLYRTREALDEMVSGLRAVGIDVYQIDHEDGNGQFEINFTYADALQVRGQFHIRENGGQRDRAQARDDCDFHAEAVLEPHRQRGAFPRFGRIGRAEERVSRSVRQVGHGSVHDGLSVPGRHPRSTRAPFAPWRRRR